MKASVILILGLVSASSAYSDVHRCVVKGSVVRRKHHSKPLPTVESHLNLLGGPNEAVHESTVAQLFGHERHVRWPAVSDVLGFGRSEVCRVWSRSTRTVGDAGLYIDLPVW